MFSELGLEGLAKSSFEVNESPVEGRCSIQPQSGVELDTEFTLLCKEWRDQVIDYFVVYYPLAAMFLKIFV